MLDWLSNDSTLNSLTIIISIGQNCLNKKNPFEYLVPTPQEGLEK